MSIAISLLALIIIAIVIIIAAALVYRAIYQRRINRQLNGGAIRPRKLLPPWAFSVIAIIAVLLALVGLVTYRALNDAGAERIPAEYINAVYDYQDFDPSQVSDYRGWFSADENPGYTKQIEQKGDIRFTYFIRDGAFDYYHPAFIVFAEYTGSKSILYYGIEGDFFMPSGQQMSGRGHAGTPFTGSICVIGTSTVECALELHIYLYDSGIKGEKMGDYAAVNEALTIAVPGAS